VPGRPGYDPARFTDFVPLQSVFAQEPRNPAWADPVERALPEIVLRDVERSAGVEDRGGRLQDDLLPARVDHSPELEKRAVEVMRFLMPGSRRLDPAPVSLRRPLGGQWVFKDLPLGDVARTLEVAAKARQSVIDQARTQGAPSLRIPIPSEAWPAR
jgi:hypothetical protein